MGDVAFEFVTPGGERAFGPFDYALPFQDGLAIVQVDGAFGAIDATGQTVIEPRFDVLRPFSEGLAAARLRRGKMGYVDRSGAWVVEPRYDFTLPFAHGLGTVVRGGEIPSWAAGFQVRPNGGRWGAVNASGELVIEAEHRVLVPGDGWVLVNRGGTANGFGPFATGGVYRYLRRASDEAIGDFEDASPFTEGLALARRKGERWKVLAADGTPRGEVDVGVAHERVTVVSPFAEGKAVLSIPGSHQDGLRYVIVDADGSVWHADLGAATPFEQGLSAVNVGGESIRGEVRGGSSGFIDHDRVLTSRPEWKESVGFRDGVGVVGLGEGRGMRLVDRDGETVLDVADWARPPSNGFVLVRIRAERPPRASSRAKPAKPAKRRLTAAEKRVAALLDDYEKGQIDNASDVLPTLVELDRRLPATSPLRARFHAMYEAIEAIDRDSG